MKSDKRWSLPWSLFALTSVCLTLIYLAFFSSFYLFEPDSSVHKLVNGKRLPADVLTHRQAEWQFVSLPDNWGRRADKTKSARYRFEFSKEVLPNQELAVYIPTIKDNIKVSLNGHWIGQSGPFKPKTAHNWNHPQLYRFAPQIIAETNVLDIELTSGQANAGFLSEIYVGDATELSKNWKALRFFKVSFVEMSSLLLIVVGLINLYLWRLRPMDSFYLWYALAAICWGIRGYLLVLPVLPLTEELRSSLRVLTLGYGVVCVALFNFRYFGYKHTKIDWALFIYSVPAAVPMLFMDTETIAVYGHLYWVKGLILIGVIVSGFLFKLALIDRQKDAMTLLFCGLPLLILGVRDMLVLTNKWPLDYGFLINHATLPALIVAMWFILRRLACSLHESEELNHNLEARIKSKEREIESSYVEKQALRNKQLLSDERERIMRDMHDGIGGHLIGLKSLLGAKSPSIGDIKDYVELALVDLRFVINSLDATSHSLSSLLGAMRPRWQKLAASQNKSLEWKVRRLQIRTALGPSKTLEIMRILEEAYTNALKHGGPDHICVSSGEDLSSNRLWIEIRNPIHTSSFKTGESGYGVENMKVRANRINATVIAQSSQGEHSLKLVLECSPP